MDNSEQWYTGKCLTLAFQEETKPKLANFHSVNIPTLAHFKVPT